MSSSVGPTTAVLMEVADERAQQNAKWGEQDHSHPLWSVIFNEEWGEANQAWLHWVMENEEYGANALDYRGELVQAAAVLIAMIEAHDRREAKDGPEGDD